MHGHGGRVVIDTSSDSVMALQDTDEGFVEEEMKAKSEGMAPPLGLPAHFALEGTAEHSIVSSLLMCISQKSGFLSGVVDDIPHAFYATSTTIESDLGTFCPHEVGSMQTFLSCSTLPTRDAALSQHFCTMLTVSIRV